MRRILENLAVCTLCDTPCPGDSLCSACVRDLPVYGDACERCARPWHHGTSVCGPCDMETPAWDNALCAFAYRFPVDELLRMAKYRRSAPALDAVGRAAAAIFKDRWRFAADVLIPVPLHWSRHWRRGFNQACELARPTAAALGLPVTPEALKRTRRTSAQSRQDLASRRRNVDGAFAARVSLTGLRVVLFDDVLTTGATLSAAAMAARAAGARHIRVLTCARADVQANLKNTRT